MNTTSHSMKYYSRPSLWFAYPAGMEERFDSADDHIVCASASPTLHGLPEEILCIVLELLPVEDLLCMQRVSRRFREIVQSSSQLRYTIERVKVGLGEETQSSGGLSYPERLEDLRRWNQRQAKLDFNHLPQELEPIVEDEDSMVEYIAGTCQVSAGYLVAEAYVPNTVAGLAPFQRLIRCISLNTSFEERQLIIDHHLFPLSYKSPYFFASDPTQDLLIIGVVYSVTRTYRQGKEVPVKFLIWPFSGGQNNDGHHHPKAVDPAIITTTPTHISLAFPAHSKLEIAGDLFALTVLINDNSGRFKCTVKIYNWQTGYLVLDTTTWGQRDFSGFSFIDSRHICLADAHNGSLDIYEIYLRDPPPEGLMSRDYAVFALLARLYLPSQLEYGVPWNKYLRIVPHASPMYANPPMDGGQQLSNDTRLHTIALTLIADPSKAYNLYVLNRTFSKIVASCGRITTTARTLAGTLSFVPPYLPLVVHDLNIPSTRVYDWSEWGPAQAQMEPYTRGLFHESCIAATQLGSGSLVHLEDIPNENGWKYLCMLKFNPSTGQEGDLLPESPYTMQMEHFRDCWLEGVGNTRMAGTVAKRRVSSEYDLVMTDLHTHLVGIKLKPQIEDHFMFSTVTRPRVIKSVDYMPFVPDT